MHLVGFFAACVACSTSVGSSPFEAVMPADPEPACEADPLEGVDEAVRLALNDATLFLDAELSWSLSDSDAALFRESGGGDHASTLGFTTAGGARAMLDAARALKAPGRPPRAFLDLGSGGGHTVLYFAILDANLTCAGYELSVDRHAASVEALARLDEAHPRLGLKGRVRFVQGDMTEAKVDGFDVVWASTLALGDGLRRRLATKLVSELDRGAVVFSSVRLFSGPERPPLVVANSWSHAHEVDVAVAGEATGVAASLLPR